MSARNGDTSNHCICPFLVRLIISGFQLNNNKNSDVLAFHILTKTFHAIQVIQEKKNPFPKNIENKTATHSNR